MRLPIKRYTMTGYVLTRDTRTDYTIRVEQRWDSWLIYKAYHWYHMRHWPVWSTLMEKWYDRHHEPWDIGDPPYTNNQDLICHTLSTKNAVFDYTDRPVP